MPLRRIAPAACVALAFAVLAALYLAGALPAYGQVLRIWGIAPFRTPFEDTETVMSALRCLRAGGDVLVANPCDPEHRVFDYSPLWLALAALPVTPAWTVRAGLAVDGAFVAALLLLPPARSARGAMLVCFGALSSGVVFALERGNNDLAIFVLAALAAALLARGRMRVAGYACLFLAGLLKYYPMLTLATALQERPRRFFVVFAAALAGTMLFAVLTWHDLTRALALIPADEPFGDMFGSVDFAKGAVAELHLVPWLVRPIQLAMIAVAMLVAARRAWRGGDRAALAALDPSERQFLLVGALLVVGCFFAAQNIGYRVIHLLLVLPALLVMRRRLAAVALALLWSEFWRRALLWAAWGIGGGPLHGVFHDALFVMKEALWWWLITALLALLFAALGSEATVQALLPARLRRLFG